MPPPQGKSQQKGKGKSKGNNNSRRKPPKAAASRAGGEGSDQSGDDLQPDTALPEGCMGTENVEAVDSIRGIDAVSAQFLHWLNRNGALYPKLEWPVWSWPDQPHDGERGVRCTEDIAPGQEMFSIPGGILFNRQVCMSSPIASFFISHKELFFSQRDELALTLMLLYEKLQVGRKSFWWPMIAALPADPGAASLWSEPELEVLQDDSLKAEAMLKVAEMKQIFAHILQLLRQSPLFAAQLYTFEEFRWALLCVESRTFGRFLPFPSLVPFADLLNHVNVHTSYRWDPARQHAVYSCDASGEFVHNQGMEAYMSYGPWSNRQLLLHYGFALADNQYETCQVQFRLATVESGDLGGGDSARGSDGRSAYSGRRVEKVYTATMTPVLPCLDALALFRSVGAGRGAGGGSSRGRGEAGAVVGEVQLRTEVELGEVEAERRALRGLKEALEGVLANCFATTLEDDEALLASGRGVSSGGSAGDVGGLRFRFAVMYRTERKRLIRRQIAFVEEAMQELAASGEGGGAREGDVVSSAYLVRAYGRWRSRQSGGEGRGKRAAAGGEDETDERRKGGGGEEESATEERRREGRLDRGAGDAGEELAQRVVAEARRLGEEKKAKAGPEWRVWPAMAVEVVGEGGGEERVAQVSCGQRMSAAVTAGGRVMTFGADGGRLGQAGNEFNSAGACYVPREVVGLGGVQVAGVACGEGHMVAVARGGGVYAWGGNEHGECGQGHKCQAVLRPRRVPGFGDGGGPEGGGEAGVRAAAAACGEGVSAVLCEGGGVYAWGRNYEGQCGVGEARGRMGCVMAAAAVRGGHVFTAVRARGRHCVGLTAQGRLWSWGCGVGGRLGVGPEQGLERDADGQPHVSEPSETVWGSGPARAEGRGAAAVVAFGAGAGCTVAVLEDGGVYMAGRAGGERSALGGHSCMEKVGEVPGGGGVTEVVVGGRGVMLIAGGAEGRAYVWDGRDDGAELRWQDVGVEGAVGGAGGDGHWLAVCREGGVRGWGACEVGELGVRWSAGGAQRLLESRVAPATVSEAVHGGVVCAQCRCEGLKGVRYSAVGGASSSSGSDICGRCLAKDEHPLCRQPTLASHRRLPPGFRPVVQGLATGDAGEGAEGKGGSVQCAKCAEEVRGVAFRCGNCVRFHLCDACYQRGRAGHISTHLFLRVPEPAGWNAPARPLLPLLFPMLTADVDADVVGGASSR